MADRAVARSAALIRKHDVFFTLGEHVGQPDCTVPTAGLTWLPTRQPVFLPNWPVTPPPDAGAFTTVLSWSINPTPPVVGGRSYGGKDVEFARFVDLPRRTADRLEAAISGDAPRERLVAAGWSVIEAHSVSATLDDYRRYLQGSRGEWSVAKNAYVATRSGWFSTRSAAYLASGRPAVIEETGFSAHVPTGPGLRAFSTPDEAVAALDAVRADHGAACEHARAVAERASARRTCVRASSPTRGCERWRGSSLASYLVRNPLGGYAWSVAHYLLGLRALGHEAWFYEDTGHYELAYDPDANTFGPQYGYGIRATADFLDRLGLGDRWVFVDVARGEEHGPAAGGPASCSGTPIC